jgi:hypothetical protein
MRFVHAIVAPDRPAAVRRKYRLGRAQPASDEHIFFDSRVTHLGAEQADVVRNFESERSAEMVIRVADLEGAAVRAAPALDASAAHRIT